MHDFAHSPRPARCAISRLRAFPVERHSAILAAQSATFLPPLVSAQSFILIERRALHAAVNSTHIRRNRAYTYGRHSGSATRLQSTSARALYTFVAKCTAAAPSAIPFNAKRYICACNLHACSGIIQRVALYIDECPAM